MSVEARVPDTPNSSMAELSGDRTGQLASMLDGYMEDLATDLPVQRMRCNF